MGYVQQVGTPLELYDSPANIFVASFIGLPPMNLFDVKVTGDELVGAGFTAALTDEEKKLLLPYQGKEIVLGVRPENFEEGPGIPVTITTNENLGMNTLAYGNIGGVSGMKVCAKLKGWIDYKHGQNVQFTIKRKHLFDKETTNAIR